jgi:acetate kinase
MVRRALWRRVELAAAHLRRPLNELRLVTLHLGNGASACAVELGHSTETSMGMTPLEGLVMGTRSGDLDPGAILALLAAGWDHARLERCLNRESGLAGLSGISNDLRDIERLAAEGNDRCRLAITVFSHRVRKYVGAYAASMGGLDAVVLTGGIGENSASMRQRVLQRFEFLGLVLDEDRNAAARPTTAAPTALITADNSRVAALAVKTDEELSIARQAAQLLRSLVERAPAPPLSTATMVALTATWVDKKHPDRIALAALPESAALLKRVDHAHRALLKIQRLGADATPTKRRDISQPGQYSCEEVVNLHGPRGRIDGVRLLGPLRSRNQIEISRTDEFKLGVDAPIRDSGKTEGSAQITVEGPKGKVTLAEGLICAKRHIHMSPADAELRGVADGDEVEVEVTGGPRRLTFGDVLIRVSPKYVLEMHIDTDEANAAEIDPGARGELVYTAAGDVHGTMRPRHVNRPAS